MRSTGMIETKDNALHTFFSVVYDCKSKGACRSVIKMLKLWSVYCHILEIKLTLISYHVPREGLCIGLDPPPTPQGGKLFSPNVGLRNHFDSSPFGEPGESKGCVAITLLSGFPKTAGLADNGTPCSIDKCVTLLAGRLCGFIGASAVMLDYFHLW